ncbi:hypothetical protein MANES_03G031047v8 [Manihot esculenta]|uniref:Uncharacterized protein n=1 Tax=Manihot esculenta TaxID=3983 RepID=A0ACB7HW25_MANES|nr:hypothetical protein MANES_03G031047v8 [Manihot esculenta]
MVYRKYGEGEETGRRKQRRRRNWKVWRRRRNWKKKAKKEKKLEEEKWRRNWKKKANSEEMVENGEIGDRRVETPRLCMHYCPVHAQRHAGDGRKVFGTINAEHFSGFKSGDAS